MKGSRWRIGDGLKVRIWEDNWFPITNGFKVISAPRGLDKDDRVENLIDREFFRWNLDLLNLYFDLLEVTKVTSIPLSIRRS